MACREPTDHDLASARAAAHNAEAQKAADFPVYRVQAPAPEAAFPYLNSSPINVAQRLLPTDSAARKRFPMATGLLDNFPDALAAVSELSYLGNEKHNPGQPLHWQRDKSMDHADCILRHLTERGGFDGAYRHSAALAWRALALLQEELEREQGLSTPRGATPL